MPEIADSTEPHIYCVFPSTTVTNNKTVTTICCNKSYVNSLSQNTLLGSTHHFSCDDVRWANAYVRRWSEVNEAGSGTERYVRLRLTFCWFVRRGITCFRKVTPVLKLPMSKPQIRGDLHVTSSGKNWFRWTVHRECWDQKHWRHLENC